MKLARWTCVLALAVTWTTTALAVDSSAEEPGEWGPQPERHGPPKDPPPLELEAEGDSLAPNPRKPVGSRATATSTVSIDGYGAPHSTVDTPDPQIAVGPDLGAASGYIVESYHRGLSYFRKNGTAAGGQLFSTLFGVTNIFDPRIVFDPYLQRFVLLGLEPSVNGGVTPARVRLAVSSGPDPTQAWTSFGWNVPSFPWSPVHPDFPSLGYDRHNLYAGINLLQYPVGTGPLVSTWFIALDKTQLVSGNLVIASRTESAGGGLPWAPRAAEQLDLPASSPPVGLFVASYKAPPGLPYTSFNRLKVYKWRNPGLIQESFGSAEVSVPTYEAPRVDAPQPCFNHPLDVLSGQLLNAVWRAGDLYAAHTIWDPVDHWLSENQVRWYQLRTGPPQVPVWWTQLVQSSEIDAEAGSGGQTFSPAIGVDANLSVGLVYGRAAPSAPSGYAHSRFIARAACEGVGVLGPSSIPLQTSGDCNTWCTSSQGCPPHRWGDYLAVVVDPTVPGRLWAVGQHLPNSSTWDTRIRSFDINPSCGPCTCQPQP